jgi:hypothetical protein
MKKSKVAKIALTVVLSLWFLVYVFLYIDIKNRCFIFTIPTYLPSNIKTKRVIKFIKKASPQDYENLCTNIRTIDKNISCGGFDGGCYQERKPDKIYLGNDQANLALSAAIVIHEVCHRLQAKENRPFSELECYTKGADFMADVVVY